MRGTLGMAAVFLALMGALWTFDVMERPVANVMAVVNEAVSLTSPQSAWDQCLPIACDKTDHCTSLVTVDRIRVDANVSLPVRQSSTVCCADVLAVIAHQINAIALHLRMNSCVALYGTVLGAARARSVLTFTNDVDFGFSFEDYDYLASHDSFRGKLLERGLRLFHDGWQLFRVCIADNRRFPGSDTVLANNSDTPASSGIFRTPVYADLYIYGDAPNAMIEFPAAPCAVHKDTLQPFSRMDIGNGVVVAGPHDIVGYSRAVYGNDWKQPIRSDHGEGTHRCAAQPRGKVYYNRQHMEMEEIWSHWREFKHAPMIAGRHR